MMGRMSSSSLAQTARASWRRRPPLFQGNCNILDAQQFDDLETQSFFGRIVFNLVDGTDEAEARSALATAFESFGMDWSLRPKSRRPRVMLLASRWDHCLADLLYRWRTGELAMDIAGVISNYPAETLPAFALFHDAVSLPPGHEGN